MWKSLRAWTSMAAVELGRNCTRDIWEREMRALDAWLGILILIRDREGSKIKGCGPHEEKNGIYLTKAENVESREICEEEEWV